MKGKPLDKSLIFDLYVKHTVDGDMISDLSRGNNIRPATLYYAFKRLGPTDRGFRRTKGEWGKLWPVNTPEAAYFYGLWCADGCRTGKDRRQLQIKLHKDDADILYKLAEYMSCNEPYLDGNAYKIIFNPGRDAYIDDVWFPSHKTEASVMFPSLDPHLYSHFVRGYFDGDGSIAKRSARPKQRQVYICSIDREFMEDLKDCLESFGIDSKLYTEDRHHLRHQTMYTVRMSTHESRLKFFTFIYQDKCEFYIKRKYDLYCEYANTVLNPQITKG